LKFRFNIKNRSKQTSFALVAYLFITQTLATKRDTEIIYAHSDRKLRENADTHFGLIEIFHRKEVYIDEWGSSLLRDCSICTSKECGED